MSEFCSPSRLRTFELVTLGGSLYVNPYWMAELSPYFAELCFGEGFEESSKGKVQLEGEEYEDIIAMLEYLCPDRQFLLKKKITDSNFAALIHCCNRFQIPSMQKELESFIEIEMPSIEFHLKAESLVEAILEAQNAHFRSSLIRSLYKKLGEHGLEVIREAIKNLPPTPALAIMEEVTKYIQVIPVYQTNATAYNWNDFSKRMFF